MRRDNATGNRSGTRLPAPLPRLAGPGERNEKRSRYATDMCSPGSPFRLRSHPARFPLGGAGQCVSWQLRCANDVPMAFICKSEDAIKNARKPGTIRKKVRTVSRYVF